MAGSPLHEVFTFIVILIMETHGCVAIVDVKYVNEFEQLRFFAYTNEIQFLPNV